MLELLYPLMQAYDSVAIEADVELGGTDQLFNLMLGRAIQSRYGLDSQCALTMPILPGTDGVLRMSKSSGNYIGVSEPPEEQFGKIMRIPDDALGVFYRLLFPSEAEPTGEIIVLNRAGVGLSIPFSRHFCIILRPCYANMPGSSFLATGLQG